MDKLIQKWVEATKHTQLAKIQEELDLVEAESAILPENLVKATAKDIVVGSILWYPDVEESDRQWNFVQEVINPLCDWKAYEAQDGCRYGLEGAFIETDLVNITDNVTTPDTTQLVDNF